MDISNEVALYVRVSTEEQAVNGDSLRTQRDELTKYAITNGFHVFKIYEDDGFSATNLKRPALQQLLSDSKNKKFGRILITKLDRLSRGVRNYYKILDTLDENGIFWNTIFEKYDSSTASGRLHINIMLSVAENESAQTSERIKSVFKTKLENKELISGKIPVGLKKEGKILVIDEDKKQIIIDAFQTFKETNSAYQTFLKLDLKYPELQINYMRAYRILTNTLYKGVKTTKEQLLIADFCEPIISEVDFDNTQKLLKVNARKPTAKNSGGYIFQGLLVCSKCGYRLGGKFYSKNPETSRYYYICKRHHLSMKCSCTTNFNEHILEQKLLDEYQKQLKQYIVNFETAQKTIIKNNDIQKQINSIENKLTKIKDLYVRDLIRIEDYEKDYTEYTAQLGNLKLEENKVDTPTENIDFLKNFLKSDFKLTYNKLDRIKKRRVWLSIIHGIVIDKDYNIQILFN